MTETGKVFLRYLYKRFGWKVIHHRKKLFRIIHKRAFETSMKKLKFVIFTNAPCKGLNSNASSADTSLLNSGLLTIPILQNTRSSRSMNSLWLPTSGRTGLTKNLSPITKNATVRRSDPSAAVRNATSPMTVPAPAAMPRNLSCIRITVPGVSSSAKSVRQGSHRAKAVSLP